MKKLKLNLGGHNQLTKDQMKEISGGVGDCIFYETGDRANAVSHPFPSYFNCAQTSELAYQTCAGLMNYEGWESCHYDCGCDGWGS